MTDRYPPADPARSARIGRRYITVTEHGATGDGVADDSAAIQAAIDAVERAGGGRVYFPTGTYTIARTLVLPSRVVLEGTGTHSSVLYLADGSNCAAIETAGFNS